MKILDVLTAPWAIEPAKLLEIRAIYATHLRGDKIDLGALEARLGRPLANEPKPYEVIDGVAVLAMEGVMAKRANMFMAISGGVSMQILGRELQDALNDDSVHSIILSIDSPGGTVDGTETLANAIRAARTVKPIVALASGGMNSAAYWAGSAASEVYITDLTTMVGNIGVVSAHRDVSKAEEQSGVKTTEIYAGKYKRIASTFAPLTEEGKASIQEQVDYTYSLFVGAVAKNRGVDEETVLKDMADGRVFMGQQAIDAGLVDGVSTLDELVVKLNSNRASSSTFPRAGAALQPKNHPQGKAMTADEIMAAYPDGAAELGARFATAERERIQAVEGQLIPGHEALVSTLKFDGKSSPGDAAMAINAAERTSRLAQANAMNNEAPNPLPQVPAKAVAEKAPSFGANGQVPADQASASALDAAAKEHQAAHPGMSYISAVKAVQQKGA